MMNVKKKISFALALLMSVSLLATGCKKTDEDTAGLSDTSAATAEITQMTTATTTEATTTTPTETEATTSEETTVSETEVTTETSSETTAVTTTVTTAETTVKTTAASKEWNETEISEVMYTSQACYSRKKAIVGAETVSQYKKGTKVNIVAATDTGYYKLADGSFIHSDYLTEEKPSSTTTAATTAEKDTPDSNTSSGSSVVSTSYNIDYTTRYGYKTLNANEKKFYKNLVEAIETLSPSAKVPDGLLRDDIIKVYGMVFNQEPQLFWMSSDIPSGYGSVDLEYKITDKTKIASIQSSIDKNVKKIMASANNYSSTISKLKVFYDWIVVNNEFSKEMGGYNSTIYNGLGGGGDLQCAGYAKSMLYLCDLAGIECMTIVGTNPEGASHAWNVVYCDNGYYNLDSTWGDPVNDHDSSYIRYNFFLVPDAWIKNDHINVNLFIKGSGDTVKYFAPPACTKTACNYFKAYNKEFSTLSAAKQGMYDELAAAIKAGKNVAQIRVTSSDIFDTLLSDSYAIDFQKYAKEQGSVLKLARQKKYSDGVLVVQYDIFYN